MIDVLCDRFLNEFEGFRMEYETISGLLLDFESEFDIFGLGILWEDKLGLYTVLKFGV